MLKIEDMNKQDQSIKVKVFNYDEYCVYELLKGKESGVTASGPNFNESLSYSTDIYAPEGISSLGIDGSTVVKVKKYLSYATVKEIDSLFEKLCNAYNLLVVYFDSSLSTVPEDFRKSGRVLKYISYYELKKNRSTKKEKTFYADKLKTQDWTQEREDIVKRAQDAVKQGNSALILGAGVSISANMPSWEKLLKNLMGEVKQLKGQTLDAFQELDSQVLEECGKSSLIMGRYLQTAVRLNDDKISFTELIQKYLYSDQNSSELLTILSHIVQQKKVNEVITYNFDDLLEQNLNKQNLKDGVHYTSIAKDAEIEGHNKLPIYHVHGIIPKNGPVDTVVFSEEEYHNRYSDAYHWSNVEQLHAFSRMHCFFIGLSMTDPNLRRLLDTAQRMNKSNGDCHFAFLRRTKLDKYCISDIDKRCKYVHVSESLIDRKKQKEIYDLNYTIIEKIYADLGVKVIWFEDFKKELPELVAKVFGLSEYQNEEWDMLVELCEKKIDEIQVIEKSLLEESIDKETMTDVFEFVKDRQAMGKKYEELIKDVYDMLSELSNRLDNDSDVKNSDIIEVYALQNQISEYKGDMTGFAPFFKVWLGSVKKVYEKFRKNE